jgi:hypothetical protein
MLKSQFSLRQSRKSSFCAVFALTERKNRTEKEKHLAALYPELAEGQAESHLM